MICPRCGAALEKSAYNGRIGFVCPERHGIAMTLGAVRALCGSRELVNLLWHKSGESGSEGGAPCPVCGKPMSKVTLDVEGQPLELDICRRCQEVWFDPNELEMLPPKPPEPEPEKLSQTVRETLTAREPGVSRSEERYRSVSEDPGFFRRRYFGTDYQFVYDWDDIDNPFKFVAAVLGLPVEADAPPLRRLPLVTWFLVMACIAVGALTFPHLDMYVREWGFIPAEFARKDGATWVTSMFMHGGWLHLIGNIYFLWIFGDNIEDELGKINYLGFVLLSGFFATLLHLWLNPGSVIPCVGASGFISGVIAMYAVLYPEVTILIHPPIGSRMDLILFGNRKFFGFPACLMFVLWLVYQAIMAWLDADLGGGVAYAAHLGGAIPGLVCVFILRYLRARRAEEFDRSDI